MRQTTALIAATSALAVVATAAIGLTSRTQIDGYAIDDMVVPHAAPAEASAVADAPAVPGFDLTGMLDLALAGPHDQPFYPGPVGSGGALAFTGADLPAVPMRFEQHMQADRDLVTALRAAADEVARLAD